MSPNIIGEQRTDGMRDGTITFTVKGVRVTTGGPTEAGLASAEAAALIDPALPATDPPSGAPDPDRA